MEVKYTIDADKHLEFWKKSGDKAVLKKIAELTRAILENPYQGIGKPEQLKHEMSDRWSRRITREHRFVYAIKDDILYVYSLKGHYK
jgi:toxin YoeB